MGLAREVYERTEIGHTGSMRAGSTAPGDLDQFQAVVSESESMDAEGLIQITMKHPESQTGKHFIDLVMFKRLV